MIFLFVFMLSVSFRVDAQTAADMKSSGHSFSAIYVFGDSTVDPGNNNYINTGLKSNFLPYGMDLPTHRPTGRFSNGRLTTDFIASYLGIKDFVPPYLNKSLSTEELMNGVSFASAGSGYDPFTAQITSAIPVQKQVEYFKEYKARLEGVLGADKLRTHIEKAGFVISCGSNDFVANYFLLPIRRIQYNLTDYQNFLIQSVQNFVQGLLDLGARKIGFVGLPPVGCLPVVVTLNSQNPILQRQCIDPYSIAAKQFNRKLQDELQIMQNIPANFGVQIVYADIYEPLRHIIDNYKKFGFEEWRRGCCGSGMLEVSYLCNHNALICPDTSKFIFWDSVHPTEKVYYLLFSAFRNVIDSFM